MTERLLIIGDPKTGKTTLARTISDGFRSTDSVMQTGWSRASEIVATWFDDPGPWTIEGVAGARALRKWHARHPDEPPPVDKVLRLTRTYEATSPGQDAMSRGIDTVFAEIKDWLEANGVEIETRYE